MMTKEYYQTLGVDPTASLEEIKRAYRKLAFIHHPDRGGDVATFQKIQEAYSTLSDAQKRKEYDQPTTQFNEFSGVHPAFEEFLRNFMFSRERQTSSLNLTTTITLEQAYKGSDLVAKLTLPNDHEKVINIKIPPGIQHGMTLRINNTDNDYRGDIYLTIIIQPHSIFQRIGDNLFQELELDAFQAMLGGHVKIKTINGSLIDYEIPSGVQHDEILQLNGFGMPNVNNPRFFGSMNIVIKIKIPQQLTEKQRNLIRQAMK